MVSKYSMTFTGAFRRRRRVVVGPGAFGGCHFLEGRRDDGLGFVFVSFSHGC